LVVLASFFPYGTEKGEELTNIPSSGLAVFATFGLSIAVLIM
jgi:hypothetical protein